LLIPTAEISPATANNTATTTAPCRKPAKSPGANPESPVAPMITAVNATATRPAIRETALLTAEPMPLWAGSTAASTAAVSGETVTDRPTPKTTRPGSICVQKSNGARPEGWENAISRNPAAAMIGPTAM
jgi:hypothetical protein